MYKHPASERAANMLNTYYDIPKLIEEELQTIRHAEEQRDKVSLPSPQITGLPGSKGTHSDKTADMALTSPQFYDNEIKECHKRIAKLKAQQNYCTEFLSLLNRVDRRLVELAYLGPKDPKEREKWLQRPTWYAIGLELGCSEAHARIQGTKLLQRCATYIEVNSDL